MLKPKANEIRKPTKTISGITPVAVMLPPRKCKHGACIYCPNLNVPQSYTPKSPVVMRASLVNYNSYEQVKGRLKAFEAMNHPTDKVEIIIMGGTFLEYSKKFQYDFVKGIYDALNDRRSKTFELAKKKNEKANCRCVALCIETRPDVCCKFIDRMRDFGCTRVELGVQILDDKVYSLVNRGHRVEDVAEATKCLRNAGFKIGYHIMPGLPGSNLNNDLKLFKKIFSDERFKPDQLKIYPCQVMPGSELEKLYWKRKYKPYSKNQIESLLVKMMKVVPRYCRVMRVMREIPPDYLVAGTTRIDLRKEIEKELRKKNFEVKEIRYREIGFALRDKREVNFDLKLKITKYKASEGDEYFFEIVNSDDILFGLLRLIIINEKNLYSPKACDKYNFRTRLASRFSNNKSIKISNSLVEKSAGRDFVACQSLVNVNERGKTKTKIALIRELHVYGQSLKLGEKGESGVTTNLKGRLCETKGKTFSSFACKSNERNRLGVFASQHRGLGKWLMSEAEKIVLENGIKKISVISGIGVREYYRKLGYRLEKGKRELMVKFL